MKTTITAKQATACLLDGEKIEVAVLNKTNYKIELWERKQVIEAIQLAYRIYITNGVERLNGFGIAVLQSENLSVLSYDFLFIPTDNAELLLLEQQIAQKRKKG